MNIIKVKLLDKGDVLLKLLDCENLIDEVQQLKMFKRN